MIFFHGSREDHCICNEQLNECDPVVEYRYEDDDEMIWPHYKTIEKDTRYL